MPMSSNDSRFLIVKKASIRPSKIVFYDAFLPVRQPCTRDQVKVSNETKKECRDMGIAVKIQPVCNKHNFEISVKAAGRIKEKVTWLYELAKNKTVTTSNGKILFAFKMNFITLTLPSSQKHQTADITSVCLNQFLTECKSKFNLQNYVWRLEFQKNGNAHYHIATDTYIDYTSCKLIWNRCLEKLGYISAYQDSMTGMTINDYINKYSDNGKIPFNLLRERYGRGTATRWNSPNTVDVRAVSNAKNIAFYISKYITKKSDHTLNKIVSEREPADTNLRLWFCSRSLSALDKIEVFMEQYDYLIDSCLGGLREVRSYIFDYCRVWYFNASEQANETKRNLWLLYRRYSASTGYVPAG